MNRELNLIGFMGGVGLHVYNSEWTVKKKIEFQLMGKVMVIYTHPEPPLLVT